MAGRITGRPTKITDELVAQAWEYLDSTTSIAVNAGGLLPTKERLALTLGVHRDTLYDWATSNDDFSDILKTLDTMQADMLMQNSLVNRYNPTISKLLLSKHGYIEKREDDITSGGEKLGVQLSASQAEQLIKARTQRK